MERELILAISLAAATLLASCAISLAVLIGLPDDYFRRSRAVGSRYGKNGFLRRAGIAVKNLLGLLLVVIGTVLALPLVPGPGLLTVAAGIALLDFPAKQRLLHKLLSSPCMLRLVNRSRAFFSRAPFVMDRGAHPSRQEDDHA